MEFPAVRFADGLPQAPRGHFHLEIYKKGVLIEVFDEENLIVDNSKQIHAMLLGGNVANNSVTKISFGTNGTAPVGGNTAITNPYTKNLDSVSYPATNQVCFNFSLGATEDNGVAILEFGLITGAGTLYARKTRATALNKDTDISFNGSWTINF